MPRLRKVYRNRDIVMVTSRTEEGLPLLPYSFINMIIWSSLAKAKELYPVDIICFCFSTNHFHMLLRVIDPEDLSDFVGYVKQEIAHGINRLLGRRKKTIWEEGYDSPVVLDSEEVFNRIAYILTNPVKDKLSNSIDSYRGVSSYRVRKRKCLAIARSSISPLKDPDKPWQEERDIRASLLELNTYTINLEVDLLSFKNCFANTAEMSELEVLKEIDDRINLYLSRLEPIKNESALKESLRKPYVPKTFGRRMICLSSIPKLRKRFISFYRSVVEQAKLAYRAIKEGVKPEFPPGIFLPSQLRVTNMLRPELSVLN